MYDRHMIRTGDMPASRKSDVWCDPEKGRTVQSEAASCDVNRIVETFKKTGVLPQVGGRAAPQYGDFSEVPSYQEALGIIERAEEAFSALPARVRQRFGNDPAAVVAFVADPRNREEAARLGLLKVVEAKEGPAPQGAGGGAPPTQAPVQAPPGGNVSAPA